MTAYLYRLTVAVVKIDLKSIIITTNIAHVK